MRFERLSHADDAECDTLILFLDWYEPQGTYG
jgi:hypothetical protein